RAPGAASPSQSTARTRSGNREESLARVSIREIAGRRSSVGRVVVTGPTTDTKRRRSTMTTATATAQAPGMTAASLPPPSRRLRSIGAVTGGLVVVAALSTAVDAVLHATGVSPPAGKPMAAGLYLLAIAYRSAFQIGGGYLTAR